MVVDIGPKIGIDGEAEFRKEINNITQQVKTYGSEMKALTAEFGKNQDSMEALEAKNGILTKSIEAQADKIEKLKQGMADAARELGETDTKTLRWKQAVNEATAELNRMKGELQSNQDAMDNFGKEAEDTGESLENAGEGAITFADVLKGNLLSQAIMSGLSAMKDAVKEIGSALMDYSRESENATKKATAYFGETGKEAEQTAGVIKSVFTDGVGEDMNAVSEAVIAVKNNLRDLSETDMKNITEQAMTLDELYGIDMNETLRGVNALMEQFGLDAQTAMDYVVSGTQNGLDKTNELGDNLAEYAGKFSQAGYSVEEYFQLLNNGLDGGAYNLDKVNDAINEVTTRLADGTIADAIESYSEETQKLFKSWQKGEATQEQVIDSIINDLEYCEGQQDALNLAATAFGTMAEDGNLKFIASLTSVGDTYDNVSGKAQAFFDATTTSQQTLDSAMRTAQEQLAPLGDGLNEIAAEVIPQLADGLTEMTEGIDWETVKEDISGAVQSIMDFGAYIIENKDVIISALAGVAAGFVAWNVASMIQGIVTKVKDLGGVIAAANSVLAANPIGIVVTLLAALAAAFVTAYNTSETFRNTVNGAFEAVKSAVTNAVNAVKSVVTVAWQFISTDTGGKMGIIQAVVNAKFQEIRTIINVVMTAIQGIMKAATQIMSGDWSGAWNTIKSTASNITGQIKTYISNTFENIKTAVSDKMKGVSESVKSGLQTAADFVKSMPAKFREWGSDMIQNLIDGIKSKFSRVGDAMSDLASTVRSFIHFSEPDVGPLSDFHTYMPDMTKMLVSGIRSGIPEVSRAMTDMSNAMVPTYANGTAAAYDRMSGRLDRLQVVLNDGTLVGKIAPKIDAAMGGYAAGKERFNV